MILGLIKVKIVEKPSNLIHFDYFSSKAWFFSMICLNFRKDTSKHGVLEFFKARVPYFKGNLFPIKEGVNLLA